MDFKVNTVVDKKSIPKNNAKSSSRMVNIEITDSNTGSGGYDNYEQIDYSNPPIENNTNSLDSLTANMSPEMAANFKAAFANGAVTFDMLLKYTIDNLIANGYSDRAYNLRAAASRGEVTFDMLLNSEFLAQINSSSQYAQNNSVSTVDPNLVNGGSISGEASHDLRTVVTVANNASNENNQKENYLDGLTANISPEMAANFKAAFANGAVTFDTLLKYTIDNLIANGYSDRANGLRAAASRGEVTIDMLLNSEFLLPNNSSSQNLYEQYLYGQSNVPSVDPNLANVSPMPATLDDANMTAITSFGSGVLDVVENVTDGLVMAGGAAASGIVGIFDEESAASIKDWTKDYIQYDWTDAAYDFLVEGVDDSIAYGKMHDIASMAGTTAAYFVISILGGEVLNALVGGLSSMANASQKAFQNGADFDGALTVGIVSGTIGILSGAGSKLIVNGASSARSIIGTLGYGMLGSLDAAVDPFITSIAEYNVYGKKDNSNYLEYLFKSGRINDIRFAAFIGAAAPIYTGVKSTINYKRILNKTSLMINIDPKKLPEIFDDLNDIWLSDSSNPNFSEGYKNLVNMLRDGGYIQNGYKTFDVIISEAYGMSYDDFYKTYGDTELKIILEKFTKSGGVLARYNSTSIVSVDRDGNKTVSATKYYYGDTDASLEEFSRGSFRGSIVPNESAKALNTYDDVSRGLGLSNMPNGPDGEFLAISFSTPADALSTGYTISTPMGIPYSSLDDTAARTLRKGGIPTGFGQTSIAETNELWKSMANGISEIDIKNARVTPFAGLSFTTENPNAMRWNGMPLNIESYLSGVTYDPSYADKINLTLTRIFDNGTPSSSINLTMSELDTLINKYNSAGIVNVRLIDWIFATINNQP